MNLAKVLFVIGAVICLPLYGFLSVTALDPVTGFLASENVLTTVFYAALLIAPVLILLSALFLHKKPAFSITNSKILAILSAVLGVVMMLNGFVVLWQLIASVRATLASQYIFQLPAGALLSALHILTAVLGGLVFLRLAISYFQENIANRESKAFLFPLAWSLICCVELFRDYPQIAGMPERMLFLLCLLAFTLFLTGQSRILGDVDFEKGIRWVNGFGLCAALFGLTMTVGEIAAHSSITLPIFDAVLAFVLALYCLFFSVNVYTDKD